MHIFYTPDINSDTYILSQEESKHCIKVLRLKNDDKIQLIDGKGKSYTAVIKDDNYKQCKVNIVETIKKQSRKNYNLHIAIAPTKNINRFEVFLEKVSEIGIDEITPILSQYSERKILKSDRLEKVIVSAIKQSKSLFKPKLSELTYFEDIVNIYFEGEKYIAHCYDSENKKHIKQVCDKGNNVLILIGPEGDFSEEEVNQAKEKGFFEISLSESRLRTETAGIVASQIIDFINT